MVTREDVRIIPMMAFDFLEGSDDGSGDSEEISLKSLVTLRGTLNEFVAEWRATLPRTTPPGVVHRLDTMVRLVGRLDKLVDTLRVRAFGGMIEKIQINLIRFSFSKIFCAKPIPIAPKPSGPVIKNLLGKCPAPPPFLLGKAVAPTMPIMVAKKAPPALPVPGKAPPRLPGPVPSIISQPTAPVDVFPVPAIDTDGAPFESRRLHWQSIPVSRFKESLFSKKMTEHHPEIDFELLKTHFVKLKTFETPKPTKTKPLLDDPPTGTGTPGTNTSVSVLETKRIQQIEIFLNQKKYLTKEYLEGLVRDGGKNTVELLESILALYPSSDERDRLVACCEEGLPKADLFLYTISVSIPEFKQAAAVQIIIHTYDEVMVELMRYFENLVAKIDLLLESASIVTMMAIVGRFARYFGNTGSTLYGFSLENLSQLKKVHSYTNREYTLLHSLREMLVQNRVLDRLITSDLSGVENFLEFDFVDMQQRGVELEKSVREKLEKIIFKNTEYYHVLVRVTLPEFLARAVPETDKLILLRTTALTRTQQLRQYFGESEKRTINELFAFLKHFKNDLIKAVH
jgi:hypothetical protein